MHRDHIVSMPEVRINTRYNLYENLKTMDELVFLKESIAGSTGFGTRKESLAGTDH